MLAVLPNEGFQSRDGTEPPRLVHGSRFPQKKRFGVAALLLGRKPRDADILDEEAGRLGVVMKPGDGRLAWDAKIISKRRIRGVDADLQFTHGRGNQIGIQIGLR